MERYDDKGESRVGLKISERTINTLKGEDEYLLEMRK